jgi:uncharacterized protein
MTMHPFTRYDLRTTDADAARGFYETVLALDFDAEPAALAVWPLHERARERGAPAHWLGSIRVDDVADTVRRLVALGGEALGPQVNAPDGSSYATVRDPSGAIVAVRAGNVHTPSSRVAWHQLHTRDADRAVATYRELFAWPTNETAQMAGLEGGHHMFAWEAGGQNVGSIANTARWPGVHPHWLYYFRVDDLDGAIAKVRANGGKALEPSVLPHGQRVSPCEDPQGAAFGLLQPA